MSFSSESQLRLFTSCFAVCAGKTSFSLSESRTCHRLPTSESPWAEHPRHYILVPFQLETEEGLGPLSPAEQTQEPPLAKGKWENQKKEPFPCPSLTVCLACHEDKLHTKMHRSREAVFHMATYDRDTIVVKPSLKLHRKYHAAAPI